MKGITVVIPVYNQAYPLSLVLYGFRRQIPPYNQCSIIVVDDGSSEPVESIVESYRDQLNVKYIRTSNRGRAAARNLGASLAKNGLLIFCDADRIPRPGFLLGHHEIFKKNGKFLTVGQVREMYVPNPESNRSTILENYKSEMRDRIPQYCKLVYNLYDDQGISHSVIPWISTFSGNMSIPLPTFWKLGGFDETFNEWGFEHFEFGYRAFLKKITFYLQRGAINVHVAHPRSPSSYVKNIRSSHSYFYHKYHDPVIKMFLQFMLGEVSLKDLELFERDQRGVLAPTGLGNDYVKITNF